MPDRIPGLVSRSGPPSDIMDDGADPSTVDRPATTEHGGPVCRWLGDLGALLPLVVVLPFMAHRDGGRGLAATFVLALVTALALPAVWDEVRRLPRTAVTILAMWLAGLVLGVVASQYRAAMVLPLLQYTIAPVLLLSVRRIWRRPWGPAALLGLLALALARYQTRSWLDWWAQTESGTGIWRPLSWRNPSAALTGMLGAWFLGMALMSRRIIRAGLGVLAATALAGTWLSSSRAGLAVTVGAVAVVAALALRAAAVHGENLLAPVVTTGLVICLAAATVGGLLAMQPAGSPQALATRDQEVGRNTLARIEHAEAAFGMFADRPLTGQGLGSYKALARQWNDPNGNLTSSAHNEYAEVAGEAGLFGLAALVGTLVGAAWMSLLHILRPPEPRAPTNLRAGLVVGAVGAAALFLVHSAVDFDWDYPVLSGGAAVALALILPARPTRRAGTWPATATAGALTALLLAGIALGWIERAADTPPWDGATHVAIGHEHLEEDRPPEAIEAARSALRWNPGSPGARSLLTLATFEQDGDVERLQRALLEQPTWFVGRARAAMALVRAGEDRLAADVLDRLHDDLDAHRAWGVTSTRLLAAEAEVALAALQSCAAARSVADTWSTDATDSPRPLPTFARDVLRERLAREGC